MNFSISQEAYLDLEQIWFYTVDKWSVEQADRYYYLIMDEITYLAKHPQSGQDYSHVRKGYFRSQIKSHLIFYKVNRERGEIEVIRILHQLMDIEARSND